MAIATPPDQTTRTIQFLPVGRLRPAPDNPRTADGGDLGDLAELAQSIKARGVLQALLVRPEADGDYLIVFGHRRHEAAIDAGLTHVPAEVRAMDDAERLELMIVENLHRDDLTTLQEARGYRQALDINSNLTQYELADRVGRSQSHISKLLKLLDLTPTAQAAVDAGKVSVTDAHQHLVKLKDDPERMDAILEQRPYNIEGAVDQQLRDKAAAAKRAKAEQKLQKAGVKVVPGPSRYGSWRDVAAQPLAGQDVYTYGTKEVNVDAEAHAKEDCHAAAVGEEGKVVLVCTSPDRHRKGGDSMVKTGLTEDQLAERRATIKRNKAARAARDERTTFMVQQLKRRMPLGELAAQLALMWTHHADGRIAEIAVDLIQQATGEQLVDAKRRGGWVDYHGPLLAYARRGPEELLRVGQALMYAAPEQQQRVDYPQFHGPDLAAHVAFLERRGYQVADVERAELARHWPNQRDQGGQDDPASEPPAGGDHVDVPSAP
jgi:ParB family chromosome partitioning protein